MADGAFDLEALRAFLRRSPFIADLGLEGVGIEPGRVNTRLELQPRFLQHSGVAHAGVLATLVDHTMGAAAHTLAPERHWILTAEIKVSLLRPAQGERLHCTGWVVKPGRSLSFTEGEVWAERGGERVLVVKASATMAVTPMRD